MLVLEQYRMLPKLFQCVYQDLIVVMPDHVHCIIMICKLHVSENPPGLTAVMKRFKGVSARRINQERSVCGRSVWQRGYFERVVRSQQELDRFRRYIFYNPLRTWLKRQGES